MRSVVSVRPFFGHWEAICFASVSYFFNHLCLPNHLNFHWMNFHAVSTFGSAMAVDERPEPRFLFFKGRCHSNEFLFSAISFFSP